MATNYPTSLDNGTSLPYPSSTDDTNSPSLAGGQDNQNDALIAVETKLGTGSSTPSGTYALVSTGTGTSSWSLATPASTIVGISDTQTLTNKTIDAANNTITNLSGSDLASNTITATQIANATITGTQLASDLSLSGTLTTGGFVIGQIPVWQYLGYAQITSNVSTSSTSFVQATGLSVTVTVPSSVTKVRVTFFARDVYNSNSTSDNYTDIWDGTVGSGTELTEGRVYGNNPAQANCVAVYTPSSGSHTYNVGFHTDSSGTTNIEAGSNFPAFILVECC